MNVVVDIKHFCGELASKTFSEWRLKLDSSTRGTSTTSTTSTSEATIASESTTITTTATATTTASIQATVALRALAESPPTSACPVPWAATATLRVTSLHLERQAQAQFPWAVLPKCSTATSTSSIVKWDSQLIATARRSADNLTMTWPTTRRRRTAGTTSRRRRRGKSWLQKTARRQ